MNRTFMIQSQTLQNVEEINFNNDYSSLKDKKVDDWVDNEIFVNDGWDKDVQEREVRKNLETIDETPKHTE